LKADSIVNQCAGAFEPGRLSGLDASDCSDNHEGEMMVLFIVLLILALIVFGVGFAVHLLWWLLIVLLVIAILSWLFGRRRA
jgi:hypothetical protein